MTAVVTPNIPLIAAAPNGVAKLRKLILELATRGKIVPQISSEEPASELVRRIFEERTRFCGERRMKREKIIAPVEASANLFDIPESWKWVRLGDIQEFTNGYAFKSQEFSNFGIGVIRIGDVKKNGSISTEGMVRLPQEKLSALDNRFFVEPGDLVITMTGDVKLAFNTTGARLLLNQRVGKITPYLVHPRFISLSLSLQAQATLEKASGSVIPNVSTEEINNTLIALPPLDEQHRIVAKVDELMTLCDRLEAEQADAEDAHAKLVEALLASLTQARDAADFRANWQQLAEHFHTLFTTEASIEALKQVVLRLAVLGKLVPQDQTEEPATEFLKRIAEHKLEAAARGRWRRAIEATMSVDASTAPESPSGWQWTTFGDATVCRDGERVPVSQIDREQRQKLYDYYGASGVIDKIDGYLFDKPLLLIGEDGANLISRSTPIAFIARGQYWVNNHAHVIDGVTEGFLRYLELYINAIDLKPYVTGTAQPKMNQAKLNSIPLAMPPEAEQRRIVAKVDELMALCEHLKLSLAKARQHHGHLASVMVEQAAA